MTSMFAVPTPSPFSFPQDPYPSFPPSSSTAAHGGPRGLEQSRSLSQDDSPVSKQRDDLFNDPTLSALWASNESWSPRLEATYDQIDLHNWEPQITPEQALPEPCPAATPFYANSALGLNLLGLQVYSNPYILLTTRATIIPDQPTCNPQDICTIMPYYESDSDTDNSSVFATPAIPAAPQAPAPALPPAPEPAAVAHPWISVGPLKSSLVQRSKPTTKRRVSPSPYPSPITSKSTPSPVESPAITDPAPLPPSPISAPRKTVNLPSPPTERADLADEEGDEYQEEDQLMDDDDEDDEAYSSRPGPKGRKQRPGRAEPRRKSKKNSGAADLVCSVVGCGSRFVRSYDRDRHLLHSHRIVSPEKAHKVTKTAITCRRCGKQFSRPDAAKRHYDTAQGCREANA